MSQPLRKYQEVDYPSQEIQETKRRSAQRRTFNLSRSKLPLITAILLFTYVAVAMGGNFSKLSSMHREVAGIEQQVKDLKEKNASLRQELQMVQSDAYIEKTAREKLGLVKKGETRVVTVPEGTQLNKIKPPDLNNVPLH